MTTTSTDSTSSQVSTIGPSHTCFRLKRLGDSAHDYGSVGTAIEALFNPPLATEEAHAEATKKALRLIESSPLGQSSQLAIRRAIGTTLVTSRPITESCFIVRQEMGARVFPWIFAYFDSYSDFEKWFATLTPEQKVLHEVRKPGMPIRAAFDLDGGADHMEKVLKASPKLAELDVPSLRAHLKQWAIEKVLGVLAKEYGYTTTADDLAICDSSNAAKFSMHITAGKSFYFTSSAQAQEFQSRVFEAAGSESEAQLFDRGCCMTILSSLRMPLCAKVNDLSRVMVPVGCTMEEALLSRPTGKCLRDVQLIDRDHYTAFRLPEGLLTEMMTLVGKTFDMSNFSLRGVQGTFMTFDRQSPSDCPLCKRRHDSEGFYVYLVGNKVKVACFAMRHQVSGPTAEGAVVIGTLSYEPIAIQAMTCQAEFSGSFLPPIEGAVTYSEPKVREYEFGSATTMMIRSPMGTEKTKALIRYLEREKPKRVLVISPRISFSEEMIAKIPSLMDYRSIPSNQQIDMRIYPHVVVQLESLHRIKCIEGESMPDLLVLDESESIISQMQSACMKKFGTTRSVWAMFDHVVRRSVKVIALDAYLGSRTSDILSIRTGGVVSQINRTPALSEKYFSFVDRNHQQVLIRRHLRAGKKVVFVCTSRKYAIAVHKALADEMPEKRFAIFHGQAHSTAKQSVQEAWDGYDMLIYTSTITVGASFEKVHYDVLHAYFHNNSATSMEGMQMMGRVRDISSKIYYLSFSSGLMQPVPTPEAIEKQILAKYTYRTMELEAVKQEQEKLSKFDMRYIAMDLAHNISLSVNESTGNLFPTLQKDLYYKIYVANLVARHASKKQFVWSICRYILEYGGMIEIDESLRIGTSIKGPVPKTPDALEVAKATLSEEKAEATEVKADIAAHAVTAAYEQAKKIAEADEIDDERYQIMGLTPMTEEEKAKYGKHYLRLMYGIPTAPLTPEWVEAYSNRKTLSLWTNLRMLSHGATFRDAIEKVKVKALMTSIGKHPLEIVDAPGRWLKIASVFEFLKVVGFDLYDKNSFEGIPSISSTILEASLPNVLHQFFTARLEVMSLEPRTKKSIQTWLAKEKDPRSAKLEFSTAMKWVNAVVTPVIGVAIKKKIRTLGVDALFQSSSFRWSGTKYLAIPSEEYLSTPQARAIQLQHEAAMETIDAISESRRRRQVAALSAEKVPAAVTDGDVSVDQLLVESERTLTRLLTASTS